MPNSLAKALPASAGLVATLLLLVAPTAAAPLAERVPPSSIVYIGWSGSDAFIEDANNTPTGNLLEAGNFEAIFDDVLPGVATLVRREDPRAGDALATAIKLADAVKQYPTALVFGGITINDDGETIPKLAVIVDAGEEAMNLRQTLAELFRQLDAQVGLFLTRIDDGRVMVYLGFSDLELGLNIAGAEGQSLAAMPSFTAALDAADGDEANGGEANSVVYADLAKLRELIDLAVEEEGDREAKRVWPELRDAIGLSGVRQYVATGGFGDDGMWHERQALLTGPDRNGLLASIDGEADLSLLDKVPADATSVRMARFDASTLPGLLRELANIGDPQSGEEQFAQGLALVNIYVGANLERDVVAQYGEDWVAFRSPSVGGDLAGWVAVNKLRDAAAFERAMTALSFAIVNAVNTQAEPNGPRLVGRSATVDGVKVFSLGTPFIAPSWAVVDGHVYFGLYPQTVAAAANLGGDFAGNEAVQAALALADGEPLGMTFTDLEATADTTYMAVLGLLRAGVGAYDMFGGAAVDPILPTLPTVMENLSPAYGVAWSDEAGFYKHAVMPFPGSTVLPERIEEATVGPVLISILLPSLNRARETANRVKSASNLRQIGLGAILFADMQRGGRLPDSMGELMQVSEQEDWLTPEVLVNPRAGGTPPRLVGVAEEDRAAFFDENSGYVWVGQGLTNSAPSNAIMAYERLNGLSDGINVLFADARVEFVLFPELQQVEQENNAIRARLGLDPIEIR